MDIIYCIMGISMLLISFPLWQITGWIFKEGFFEAIFLGLPLALGTIALELLGIVAALAPFFHTIHN